MQKTVSFYLSILYRDFFRYCAQSLKDLGLSYGQLPFILYVGKHPGCAQSELTRSLGLDWGHCQRSVTRLVESGFMAKTHQVSPACNTLTLTELGMQAFRRSHELFTDWDSAHLQQLTPEEQTRLLELLSRIAPEFPKEGQHAPL